ncbi:MAG: molecular chaperone HtpG [Bacilli bacterium]|nr:molecular chaperone HtpG [Bacilli bacterium]
MRKKEFKAESKKLLNLMINSIYTNQEIFLRELISNSSDALDKLYYESLTNKKLKIKKDNLKIDVSFNKEKRTITISDNGCGMNSEELENNLGTIAKSGSELFKENLDPKKNINIIGQFGVGFYSSFMVSDKVEVRSRRYDMEEAYLWRSSGADGYTIEKCDKDSFGTEITLYLKDNDEHNNYDSYLDDFKLESIIKKYSDYITYPIVLHYVDSDKEEEKTVNSMIPIWKKDKKSVSDDEYNNFYIDRFYDYEKPLRVIKSSVEGLVSYDSLMFIPSHAPFDYYNKDYEKGLELYSRGVMIMEKCSDLLPDYFSFVKGVVDSLDVELNISRESLQRDHQIKTMAKSIETKIKKELLDMLKNERDNYVKVYKDFGNSLKFGIYSNPMAKETLEDLLMFNSSKNKDYVTLEEYQSRMLKEQKKIYYASGESVDKIDMLPQVNNVKDKGYEVLYFSDYLDEFTIKAMGKYHDLEFQNILDEKFDLDTKEEKEALDKLNSDNKDMFDLMKSILKDEVSDIHFTNKLKDYPVCLSSVGDLSIEMEKTLNAIPGQEKVLANKVLEKNEIHTKSEKLKDLYTKDKELFEKYTKVLYATAREISGLRIENPNEFADILCNIISK